MIILVLYSNPLFRCNLSCPLCCCAFNCSNCDFPNCIGFKGNCRCLCIEEEGFFCKLGKRDNTCCVCFSTECDLVSCPRACRVYRQCCCFEWICGCPLNNAYVDTQIIFKPIPSRETKEQFLESRPVL